jgi:thermostable 8-oxoguanine DNA glycosylase
MFNTHSTADMQECITLAENIGKAKERLLNHVKEIGRKAGIDFYPQNEGFENLPDYIIQSSHVHKSFFVERGFATAKMPFNIVLNPYIDNNKIMMVARQGISRKPQILVAGITS